MKLNILKILVLIGSGVILNYSAMSGDLIDAIIHNKVDDVELLLHCGVDVNQEDAQGYTPLINAIISNNSTIAKLLLIYGADAYYCNKNNQTALHFAQDNISLISFLKYNFYIHHKPDPIMLFLAFYLKNVHSYYNNKGTSFNLYEYRHSQKPLYLHPSLSFELKNPLNYALLSGDARRVQAVISTVTFPYKGVADIPLTEQQIKETELIAEIFSIDNHLITENLKNSISIVENNRKMWIQQQVINYLNQIKGNEEA